MANEVLVKQGAAIVWSGPQYDSAYTGLTKTNNMTLSGLPDGSGRCGEMVDLGSSRSAVYAVYGGIWPISAPTAGLTCEVYWCPAPTTGIGILYAGKHSGVDAGYQLDETHVDEFKKQLVMMGVITSTADGGDGNQQFAAIGEFSPTMRYGAPMVKNDLGVALATSGHFIAMIPIVDEIQ